MSTLIIIEEFKTYENVSFYTIRYDDSDLSETDKFIKRFTEEELDYKEDLDELLNFIHIIGQRGLKYIRLREENNAHALPPYTETSNLRLFCIKLSNSVLILGNGGIKSSQAVQESKDLSLKFYDIINIERSINELFKEGSLSVTGNELTGDLEFYI